MRKKIMLLGMLLFSGMSSLVAQNEIDAFRYSATTVLGTSRSMGAGGAFSAVGADFSATSLNPAGLAVYRRSDLMFTPSFRSTQNNASYLGSENKDGRSQFSLSNIGYVHAAPVYSYNRESKQSEQTSTGLKSYAFAVGYNQISNFNRRTTVSAYNPINSITDYFAGQASGQLFNDVWNDAQSIAGLASGAGLIDTSVTDGNWVGAALGGQVDQTLNLEERGRNNEWNIGLAGNFSDKVYAGVDIGIQGIRYNSELYFTEDDVNNTHSTWANDSTPIQSMAYRDIYGVRGTGVNVRLGIIARPIEMLRLGISFQSPTWFSMTDEYSTNISSTYDNDPQSYGLDASNGIFTYNFTSPFKMTLGAMALIKKYGFISADFDYMDYSTAEFKSDVSPGSSYYYDFFTENQSVRSLFSAAYNLRLGGEMRFGPGRLRLGYSNFGSILKDEYLDFIDYETGSLDKIVGTRQMFTGGLGFKQKSYYIDIAYAREYSQDRRLLYTVQNPTEYSPELINHISTNIFSMTIGFTF